MIFIESNIHAREWITSATATFILNSLLTLTNENFRTMAYNFDWVIVPIVNVDGFEYTHTTVMYISRFVQLIDRQKNFGLFRSSFYCVD